jgi:hypothetical protein
MKGIGNQNGSALIMVLWTLVLIGFLAGEYLDHNRGKACFAENAWDSVRQRHATNSVLQLFATNDWPIPEEVKSKRGWTFLSPGDVDLWVKVESESNRININTAPEDRIKETLKEILGEEQLDTEDPLVDAILDWRDSDGLVRLNGAEAEFYESEGVGYGPANGPFKVLTELLLVRGVTRDMFWGNPMNELTPENNEDTETLLSMLDGFTIYDKDIKRVSVLVPGRRYGYMFVLAFLEEEGDQWRVRHIYQNVLSSSDQTINHIDQGESLIESS